jgi:Fe-S cluster biogenesis protein NfuA
MGGAFNLGRIFGIQFRLHYTWFIIFVLVAVSLSWQYFPLDYPGWKPQTYWVIGIVASLLFFASVVAHELAHSLVGRANGVPVKSITLFIFGGVAHMTREAARHGAELKMAAAGPASAPSALPTKDDAAMYDVVARIFDTQINPTVAQHGGQVELIDVQEGTVVVRMMGGCQGCGLADVTLKQGIEAALKRTLPGIGKGSGHGLDHACLKHRV